MSNTRAPNVGSAFNYTDDKFNKVMLPGNSSAFDDLSDADSVKTLRFKMAEDGIVIDGDDRLLGMGSMGVIAFAHHQKRMVQALKILPIFPGLLFALNILIRC
jgi:hypothetical protein